MVQRQSCWRNEEACLFHGPHQGSIAQTIYVYACVNVNMHMLFVVIGELMMYWHQGHMARRQYN
jgi:hypothetical protein